MMIYKMIKSISFTFLDEYLYLTDKDLPYILKMRDYIFLLLYQLQKTLYIKSKQI